MPIHIRKEKVIDFDIFNAPEEVKVVTINCVGAMGKGVAESAKMMYPELYKRYRALCNNKAQHINYVWDWTSDNGKTIIMFPTKKDWRDKSITSAIVDNLAIMRKLCEEKGYLSVAATGFGMGNGWLNNKERFEVFEAAIRTFKDSKVDFKMYVSEDHLVQYKKDLGHI